MSRHYRRSRSIGRLYLVPALVALGGGLFLAAVPLQASPAVTITVNSTADVVNPADNLCTLREAVRAANTDTSSGAGGANALPGTGPIAFACPRASIR